jgi:hypothetical protein
MQIFGNGMLTPEFFDVFHVNPPPPNILTRNCSATITDYRLLTTAFLFSNDSDAALQSASVDKGEHIPLQEVGGEVSGRQHIAAPSAAKIPSKQL